MLKVVAECTLQSRNNHAPGLQNVEVEAQVIFPSRGYQHLKLFWIASRNVESEELDSVPLAALTCTFGEEEEPI